MLKLSQELRLSQKLDVRMIQSLKLLPLTTMQLEQRINQELEQNPMLQADETLEQQTEEDRSRLTDESGQVKTDSTEQPPENDFTEAEWLKYMDDGFDYSYRARQEFDPNVEERESTHTYTETLSEHLMDQLGVMIASEYDREIGEFVIGCINDDGYLELNDAEIAVDLDVAVEDVRRVRKIIQQFDPAGVGARDLRESLLIQLRERHLEGTTAWRIIDTNFQPLTQRKFKEIMRDLSLTEDDIKDALNVISVLSPRPGSVFKDVSSNRIVPDILVEKVDGEYEVMLNDRSTPQLTISPSYRKLLDKNADTSREARKYLVDKLNSARWFINSIEQRRTTILRVSRAIIDRQREFLEHGISHLRPMTLQDIADNIGVAISTVQRVTSGKYIQTPQGVYELKYFFSQRISSSNGTEDLSAMSVKDKLKTLIENEDSRKPLSDQKITDILNDDGVSISRRAIAKYRDELQIPPARMRKEL